MLEEIADSMTLSGIVAAVIGCVAAVVILVMRIREKSSYQRISTVPATSEEPMAATPATAPTTSPPQPTLPSPAPLAHPQPAEEPDLVPLPTIPALAPGAPAMPAGTVPAAPTEPTGTTRKIAFKAYTPPVVKPGDH